MKIQNYFVEFVSTVLFSYIILSTSNIFIVGAVFTLIVILYKNTMFMNPAITIMMSSMNKIPVTDVIPFCLAQLMGSLLAFEIYKRVKP